MEVRDAEVKVEVLKDGEAVAGKAFPVKVLAQDIFAWDNDCRLFAAFATRNAMTIACLHSHIAAEMKRLTGDPSIHSYQGTDAAAIGRHCLNLCRAIYNAVQAHGIHYDEPKDVEGVYGQKIRLADNVFVERQATCLDSALLFAAIMESCGLNPVLLIKTGHAFVGCHLQNEHFSCDVLGGDRARAAADIAEIKRHVASSREDAVGRFIAIETTCVGAVAPNGGRLTFDDAVRRGRETVEDLCTAEEDGLDHFRCALDIRLARRNVRPLESALKLTVETCPVKPVAEYAQVLEKGELDVETFDPSGQSGRVRKMPPRVKDWASELMQLTHRNPLLSRAQSKCLINVDCTGSRDVGEFFDWLSSSAAGYTFANRQEIGERYGKGLAAQGGNVLSGDVLARLVPVAFANRCLCVSEVQEKPGRVRRAAASRASVKLRKRVRRAAYVADLERLAELARASAEETGAETLYAAVGALEWESADPQGKVETCRAPVLLVPVELQIARGTGGCRVVRRGGRAEAILNEPLLKFLEARGVAFDDFAAGLPSRDGGVDALRVLHTLDDRVFNRSDVKVVYDVCLGHFTFGSYALWADVRNHVEKLEAHPVVRQLIDMKGVYRDGVACIDAGNLQQHLRPGELYCPRPMDSTQLTAVLNSAVGKSFILNGPPGTGKSHTITNIIAHNLALGRRILFVAQKETALAVVKRGLNEAGLAPFCLLLDAEGGPAALFRQFEQSIKVQRPADAPRRVQDLAARRRPLEAYVTALHAPMACGQTPFQCLQVYFEQGRSAYADRVDAACCRLTEAEVEPRRKALGDFARCCAVVQSDLAFIAGFPRLKIAGVSITAQARFIRACERVRDGSDALLAALGTLGDGWGVDRDPSRPFLAGLLRVVDVQLRRGLGLDAVPASYYQMSGEELDRAVAAAVACADGRDDLRRRCADLRARLGAWCDVARIGEIDVAACRDQVAHWMGRSRFRKIVMMTWPSKNPLKALGAYRTDGKAFADGDEALAFLADVADYRRLCDAQGEEASEEARVGVEALSPASRAALEACRGALAAFDAAVGELAQFVADEELAEGTVSATRGLAVRLLGGRDKLHAVLEYRALRVKAVEARTGGFVELVEKGEIPPAQAVSAFDHALATRRLDQMLEDPAFGPLDAFDVDRHGKAIAEYREGLARYQEASVAATFAKIAERYPDFTTGEGLPDDQNDMLGRIKNCIVHPDGCTSVRRFLADISPLLERIKPCLLMTPTSVAQLLPMDAKPFDLVIFDEASQLKTCDAVGAIARGRQVIVAGDPMQMPPSRDVGVSNKTLGVLSGQELPSILEECLARGFHQVRLQWHYRSRHESLIRFSNERYYKGLNTFPSVCESRLTGLQYRFVPDGVWAGRCNEEEALRVVDYVIDAARSFEFQSELRGPSGSSVPTIGVVAFNEAQQEVIGRFLKRRADADFLFPKKPDGDAGGEVPTQGVRGLKPVAYFVKNLESVQGDEADVIVFSVGYGPTVPRGQLAGMTSADAGKCFPRTYGWLSGEGGEKRLNVAITRGRRRMMVFASIRSGEVNVTSDARRGPADFRDFLRMAERSVGRTLGDSTAAPARGLVQGVAKTLDELGYDYVAMVGASACKIDLAVKDRYDAHRFLLGIECDGPMYRGQTLAMDRDVGRTAVLRGAQWSMYRVWSAEWYGNPAAARERLKRTLDDLSEKALARRRRRWREICLAKDAEMREIEDFAVRDDVRDVLDEVVEELGDVNGEQER